MIGKTAWIFPFSIHEMAKSTTHSMKCFFLLSFKCINECIKKLFTGGDLTLGKTQERNPYFASNIRQLRLKNNMSQEELALALGASALSEGSRNLSSMVSGWERGDREPSLEMLRKIAKRFEVTTDWILGAEESINSDFQREAQLLLLEGEKCMSDEDKAKLLKIIEIFVNHGD